MGSCARARRGNSLSYSACNCPAANDNGGHWRPPENMHTYNRAHTRTRTGSHSRQTTPRARSTGTHQLHHLSCNLGWLWAKSRPPCQTKRNKPTAHIALYTGR